MNHPLHILATLAPAGYAIIAIILFSIWISARICRRREMKGCFTIGYVTLIVFSLMMLCSGMVYMLVSYTAEKTDALAGGKRYTATIVDFDYRENTDDDGNHSIGGYP